VCSENLNPDGVVTLSEIGPVRTINQQAKWHCQTNLNATDEGCWSEGHCQTNLSGPAKGAGLRRSRRQLTPLGQGNRTVLFEDIAAVEVTVLVEVIVDRGMGSGKLLEGFHAPELRHRSFSSSEGLV
jgi:hypothetical protein